MSANDGAGRFQAGKNRGECEAEHQRFDAEFIMYCRDPKCSLQGAELCASQ